MRILAAMSGGVDSAVAAARAVDAGHDVVGVHLALSRAGGTLRTGSRGCCTIEDAMDARRAADRLGIPFYVWDFSERFRDDVIDDFVIVRYLSGDASTEPTSVKIYNTARAAPTPALNALASLMLLASFLAVIVGLLAYRRLRRGEGLREPRERVDAVERARDDQQRS